VPVQTKDYPGLIVARTLSMIVNEANDAVLQGVCSKEDANAAMRLGANYPAGPFDWQNEWGAAPITKVLDSLNDFYRGERYRVSPGLRQAAWREHVKH
jgi:3-hydroxybutyryl-CoA dehydrogenase